MSEKARRRERYANKAKWAVKDKTGKAVKYVRWRAKKTRSYLEWKKNDIVLFYSDPGEGEIFE